ncbi:MAG TPA: peptidylprolyl isomerase [Vicinamibacterales bacterium]|nr:peptidylprolyl isomerase [Vicinamibacterales bacterium]
MSTSWLREPLVHFLAIGALLFVIFEWRGAGPASRRIVITPGQVEAMAAGFARTWQREPTEEELKGLIDEYVREEIATREAIAAGLDRDDTVVRRRLRQKWEFITEDSGDTSPPSDAELQAWLDAHGDRYREETEIAFAQRMPGGETRLLPQDVQRTSRGDVARMFGDEFAAALLRIEPGRWTGPIRSGYGLHEVYVKERHEGRMPALEDVRPQVERDVMTARRQQQLQAAYEALLKRYQVVIERRGRAAE